MSGAGGKWMVSSITEGHNKKLRKAGYLSSDIAHRLPEKGQLIPAPRPHERVVFLPHFLRGLVQPLPFVGEKVDPYPLIWVEATTCPHQPRKTCLSPSAVIKGAVGLPTPVLM